MYKILVSDKLGAAALERLKEHDDMSVDVKTGLSKEQLLEVIPEYDALIVRSGTQVTAEVLAAGKKLRVVGRAGVGVDNIDVKAATMSGVVVMNTPGANSMATAELTLALMLAVSRNIAQAHGSLKAGEWRRSDFVGVQLHHKVLGIVGFGRVGKLVAERARAFGMDVLVYDPLALEETAREMGVMLVEMDELLSQSDYITLHAALNPATTKLINATSIAQMKDGVILINAARGKLMDEAAVAEGLKSGKIKAAAIDVYSSEPPPADHPLLGLPNVVHVPHLGAGTDYPYAVNMPFELEGDYATVRPYLELAETLGRLQAGLADKPIRRVEVEVQGDVVGGLVRAIGAALLKGLLEKDAEVAVNYINAPVLAHQRNIAMTQTVGINSLDYPNLIACRAVCDGGQRLLAGVLFGGTEPRIAQVDDYRLEARPEGVVLIMKNRDVPGVIGQVGTLLAAYEVNIGEWRLGRNKPGGEALSFINLDGEPSEAVLHALSGIEAVTQVKVVKL